MEADAPFVRTISPKRSSLCVRSSSRTFSFQALSLIFAENPICGFQPSEPYRFPEIQTAGHGRILGFQGVAGHLDEKLVSSF